MPVLGMARLKITLHRKVTMIITAFVLPDLVHGVDLNLGESWLKSHRVTLDYRTNKCIIHRPKGKINIKPCDSILLTPKSSWTAALSTAAAPVFSGRLYGRLSGVLSLHSCSCARLVLSLGSCRRRQTLARQPVAQGVTTRSGSC